MKNYIVVGATCLIGSIGSSMAGTVVSEEFVPEVESRSGCDLFDLVEFYKNPDNRFIQSIAFTGRLQADGTVVDADELGDYEAVAWRRVRGGFKAKVFNDFTLHAEADFDLSSFTNPDYNRLTDSYIAWSPSSAFKLKLGKQSAGFTLDGATSSKKLLTIDRGSVANNLWFPSEYFTGVSVAGSVDNWNYKAGYFSSDGDPEFGSFDDSQFGLLSLGRDISDCVSFDKAEIRLDYVYQDLDANDIDANTRNLEHVISLVSKWDNEDWGIWTDISFADGIESEGQSDIFGMQFMPYYNFTDKIQGVFRYTYLESDDDNGVRLSRYDARVESGRGDELQEFYLGLNYYICDHKLKVQTGIQYSTMQDDGNDGGDYDGWGATAGVRLYW